MAWWDSGDNSDYNYDPSTSLGSYSPGSYDLGGIYDNLQNYGGSDPSAWTYASPDDYGGGFQVPQPPQFDPSSQASAFEGQYAMPQPQMPPTEQPSNGGPTTPGPAQAPRLGAPGQKPNESIIGRAVRGLTEAKPGTIAQSALGLGGLGLIGAGLAKKTPSVNYPGRNVQLSPQEQAAATALAAERAKAQGTLESRGYAGEEGIRDLINKQLTGALQGNDELANPSTMRAMQEQRVALTDQLRRDLGPGAFGAGGEPLATAAQNALKNFDLKWQAILDAERQQAKQFLQTSGMQRSAFTNQLQMQPAQMAAGELGTLSQIGTQDAALRAQIDAANQASASADKRGLLQTGGTAAGMAISPWLYQMMLQNVQQKP